MSGLKILFWCFFWEFSAQIVAQTTIKGTVQDEETGEELIGASVLIVGTSLGTVTDFDGSFELSVDQLPVNVPLKASGAA